MCAAHHQGTSPPEDIAIMKSTAIACAVAAASLGFGSLSYAQGWDRDARGHDRPGYSGRDHRAEPREARQDWREAQVQRRLDERRHQYAQRHHEQNRYQQPVYTTQGHYGQGQWTSRVPQYRRGDYLPHQLRQRQYYVNDWRAHRLYAPPQGYHWVQADNSGDFLLVAIATGLIANLLLSQ
jgi:Ni/Co efflux regulator RcnB